jgi:hypothetical protein
MELGLSTAQETASCAATQTSQHFMGHIGSLPHSQQLSTYPYPEPEQSSQNLPILSLQDPS